MTSAKADPAKEADKPQETVQHLAQAFADLNDRVDVLGVVSEKHDQKLAKLLEQQQAAGVLLHGLTKDKPGDAVKPSKLDNLTARVETLERSNRAEATDYVPMIDALTKRVNDLAEAVGSSPVIQDIGPMVADLVAKVDSLDKAIADPAYALGDDLQKQVDQLEARLARFEHDGGPDTVGDQAHQALTEWTENQVNALGVQLNELGVNLSRRLEGLESGLQGVGQTVASAAFAGRPPMGVHAKMLALMDEVTAIGKDRRASGGGVSFKFRGVEDAQNAVGQAQRKVRILILPDVVSWEYGQEHVQSEKDGKVKTVTWSTSRLTMRYTFVDPDDGSQMSVTMVGEGKDNSDKSASKAASMACKYALFQALMIPFEDVDESDKQADARAESYRQDTPGARVNRDEISPAQAVDEYQQQSRQQQAAEEMTPLQKAATLVEWVKKGMAQPVEQALKTVQTAMERSTAAGLNDLEVEGIPVRVFLTTALQSVSATLNERAASAGAQGMTRQEQQAGQATRAAAHPRHPVANPTMTDMEDALALLDRGDVPPEVLDAAQQTVNNFEESNFEESQ